MLIGLAVMGGLSHCGTRSGQSAQTQSMPASARAPLPTLEPAPDPAQLIVALRDGYGIDVFTTMFPDDLGTNSRVEVLDSAERATIGQILALFATELRRYPRPFLERARLRSAYLVRHVEQHGHRVSGVAGSGRGWIALEARHATSDVDQFRATIHHEIYHLIDWNELRGYATKDLEWSSLNPPGGRYIGHYATERVPGYDVGRPPRGFASHYATTFPMEDKAEVFKHLMMPRQRTALLQRAAQDASLRAKIGLLVHRAIRSGFEPDTELAGYAEPERLCATIAEASGLASDFAKCPLRTPTVTAERTRSPRP